MSKLKIKEKYYYSKTQYFFWLLSGAEISILKECPTDFNRQAGIGFTIFMTTLLAFFSGSYAGYYFGESYTVAITFGIIWSALIFSIDRSMVVTMKKDPTKENQKFWAPFFTRAVLSLLIAFIISIPLELLIFKDNIDIHKREFTQNKTLKVMYGQQQIQDIEGKQENENNLKNDIEKIDEKLSLKEPNGDPEYDQIKKTYKQTETKYLSEKSKLNSLLSKKNKAEKEVDYINNTGQRNFYSTEYDKYQKIIARYENQEKKTKISYENYKIKLGLRNAYIKKWFQELKSEQLGLENDKKEITKKIRKGEKNVDEIAKESDSIINKHNNSFIFNFMVLEDLARPTKKVLQHKIENNKSSNEKISNKAVWVEEHDPEGATMFFILWLIRILFFVIEILPTIAKMATPIGAYDRAIYQKEKDLEKDLLQKTEGYLGQQKILRDMDYKYEQEQINERNKIENELHKEILIEIASAQNLIAKKKIEEFKNLNS